MAEAGDRARLVAEAAAVGVTIGEIQAAALLEFSALLQRWNRAFNLVSRRDAGRFRQRHLLDSLSAAPHVQGRRILDLGTGAGLPGVPLAVVRSESHFTLVDRNARRIRFVGQAARRLGLTNVTAWRGDVAELPASAAFDTVVCRAVAGPAGVWPLAAARLAPRGRLVIMHRSRAPHGVEGELDVPPGARLMERIAVTIPGLPEAHELVVLAREGRA